MKKLSKVQLKQQAAVLAAVNILEEKAIAELNAMQAWFSMDYDAFPGSLLVRIQFENESEIERASPQLLLWQKRLSALLVKKGIVLKDMRRNLIFTVLGPDD